MEYFPCSLAEMYLSFGGSFPALKINNTHVYALRQRTDKEIAIVSTSYLEEWPETGPLKDIRLSSIQIRAASLMCCHHFQYKIIPDCKCCNTNNSRICQVRKQWAQNYFFFFFHSNSVLLPTFKYKHISMHRRNIKLCLTIPFSTNNKYQGHWEEKKMVTRLSVQVPLQQHIYTHYLQAQQI